MQPKSVDDIQDKKIFACQDKLAFDNKASADASALVAKYQHGTKLKVYLCKHCGLWHLASA